MLTEGHWIEVRDGDARASAIFRRHYTARAGVDYCRYGFSGKGESMVLLTEQCDGLLCWRKVEGEGIVCSVFRNEGSVLSSELIKEAVQLASQRWRGQRLYTYVNARIVKGDGKCFKAAGFKKLRQRTKKLGLIELELIAQSGIVLF